MSTTLLCPDCTAPLSGGTTCPACRLRLVGPAAARLHEVDLALAELGQRRSGLLAERTALLAELRRGAGVPAPRSAGEAAQAAPVPSAESSRASVQHTLLGLGGLLLAGAAVVFTAVTYERLGAGGRAGVLLVLTLLAGLAAPALLRRGLSSSAETTTGVLLALGALDAYGLWALGLGRGVDGLTFAALAAATLAAGAGGYGVAVPVRLAPRAAVALAQLPPVLLLAAHAAGSGTGALVLVLLAAADLLVSRLPVGQLAAQVARRCGAAAAAAGGLLATAAAQEGAARAALALVALAALSAVVAAATRDPGLRGPAAAAPAPLLALGTWAQSSPLVADPAEPLVVVAVGLTAALAAGALPPARRAWPLGGAVAVVAAAAVTQAGALAEALVGPLTWLAAPWTAQVALDTPARSVLSPFGGWTGTVVAPAVLAVGALALGVAGRVLPPVAARARVVLGASAAGTGVVAAVLAPLGLDLPYALAPPALLGLAAALIAGALVRSGQARTAALVAAVLPGLLAAGWSTADRTATLAVLPVAVATAALAATGGTRRTGAVATALAGLLAGAELAAVGTAAGLPAHRIGALLLLGPAALLAVAARAPRAQCAGAEAAAALLAVAAVGLSSGSPASLSGTLAGLGLLALAAALRPDRRALAVVGALLMTASSWVRLAEAGVEAPEPYTLPLGVLALALGVAHRRRTPSTGSMRAYGPGLSALLLPSLLAALVDDTLTRPLLLGLAALAVLLVGVRTRLRAPLVHGGGVLAIDAVHLLTPYAAALPRWVSLGAAGLLLLVLGATYERRRADLERLQRGVRSLA